MKYSGVLRKMPSSFADPIHYYLQMDQDVFHLNQLIDKNIRIEFDSYQCLNCGLDKKIFRQGFCYDCFSSSPEVGEWIIRPELSKAHLGIEDRDLAYEESVQLKPHIVYLANSSNVKVGVTRKTQVPTRWIDQGASEALAILEAPNRYLAGITEVALKNRVADKTDWRKMLKNQTESVDLKVVFQQLKEAIPEEAKPYLIGDSEEVWQLHFPMKNYPEKIKSLNLDKSPELSGRLKGIKGQYLYLAMDSTESIQVFNVRNHEGYRVRISFS